MASSDYKARATKILNEVMDSTPPSKIGECLVMHAEAVEAIVRAMKEQDARHPINRLIAAVKSLFTRRTA